jgi:hypothetical protein
MLRWYCSANLQVGNLQLPVNAHVEAATTQAQTLFRWHSLGKAI